MTKKVIIREREGVVGEDLFSVIIRVVAEVQIAFSEAVNFGIFLW